MRARERVFQLVQISACHLVSVIRKLVCLNMTINGPAFIIIQAVSTSAQENPGDSLIVGSIILFARKTEMNIQNGVEILGFAFEIIIFKGKRNRSRFTRVECCVSFFIGSEHITVVIGVVKYDVWVS